MSEPIRILLVDDHVILREGTAVLLRREAGLEVVGEASDGQQAIEMVELLRPDVVVMDVRMPGMSGGEATRRICQRWPDVPVLVLTAHDDDSAPAGAACGPAQDDGRNGARRALVHAAWEGEGAVPRAMRSTTTVSRSTRRWSNC